MNSAFLIKIFLFSAICLLAIGQTARSQNNVLTGKITESKTSTPISSVSVSVFTKGKFAGTVCNIDGEFRLSLTDKPDSIKFSCIGFKTLVFKPGRNESITNFLKIKMETEIPFLEEVIIKPLSALEIVQNAIVASQKMIPDSNFENDFFYREIIKDRDNYFSVAEAVFKGQFIPLKKDYKLKLLKGRSKEDVSYTRLFEDFHPGGGPQALFENKILTGFPDFLTLKKLKLFNYKKEPVVRHDGKLVYVISFDQKPGVKEALDKGMIFINGDDYSIIKYESESSPLGIQYVKNLTGTDKLFAELLHIEFERKSWARKAEFVKYDSKLYLLHASGEYNIGYKQPKKQLDLDLVINTEMVCTTKPSGAKQLITKDEEWKRKNIVANLPTDFDTDFWGDASIISPTAKINELISEIGKKNLEQKVAKADSQWQQFQKDFFVAYQIHDTIAMIPIMKGSWEDKQTAGMLYQSIKGDFFIETELNISKRSKPGEIPNNGFQQAGIIIRNPDSKEENNLILCIGTPGNKSIKYFLRKTQNGNSKNTMNSISSLHQWLRLERRENIFSAFIREGTDTDWKRISSSTLDWNSDSLEVGFMVMARFAGQGPKMKPDMKAQFNNTKIKKIK